MFNHVPLWCPLLAAVLLCACQAPGQGPTATRGGDGLPVDTEYVQVDKDGHLSVNGQRQRYWSAIGKLYMGSGIKPEDSAEVRAAKVEKMKRGTDALIARFIDLGFNSVRLWDGFHQPADYTPGDGSQADAVDYFVSQAKKAGFRIWTAGMNRVGEARPEDVGIIADAATADAWAAAVRELSTVKDGAVTKGRGLRPAIEKMWDPRMEALLLRDMKNVATHMNKHTGLRWCDDPVFAVWELSNEEWWMRKMVGGQWQKLPTFFRNSLVARWNQFLVKKYGSQEALVKAWGGLLKGEQLAQGTVLLAPMAGKSKASVAINDANAHALAALESLDQEYGREDFAVARGNDVIEFFMDLQLSHKQRLAAGIKPLGKSTRLSPMIYDTGIGYEIQSQYLHQNADAVSHDAYVNGVGPKLEDRLKTVETQPNEHQRKRITQEAERIAANVGRWVNWLLKPPGIAQGVPWLEHNKVEGKPFLAYETQIQQPAKYRADYPLRLVALASIQDWDWICWHYFASGDDVGDPNVKRPFDKKMDITTGSHPQGYHFTFDEVQTSMMRAAGHIFTGELLKPAANPTIFVYGRKSLYDPQSMDYGGSYGAMGLDMLQTVYQYGSRIRIDPTREDDEVIGPVVKFEDRHTHNPYTPTPQITFDWKKGYLMFDSPHVIAWTGLLANYGTEVKFANGVTLTDVSIRNDEGMFEPMGDDEKYIAFALYSEDDQPLDKAKRIGLSLVSTSFNTGFALTAGATKGGDLPVLTARVAGTIHAPALNGMTYTLRDWHMMPIGTGKVVDGMLKVPSDKPVFFIELERSAR